MVRFMVRYGKAEVGLRVRMGEVRLGLDLG